MVSKLDELSFDQKLYMLEQAIIKSTHNGYVSYNDLVSYIDFFDKDLAKAIKEKEEKGE